MPTNYFLYARKSTDVEDKQVRSIEDQLAVLRALAKQEGLVIVEEFIEKQSAKMPGRPVFNEMMQKIERGEVQGILCWKLDRLARNPVDGGQISWFLQRGIIQHIRTNDRDHRSTDNVLMMAVELGMANQYILDLASNTKRALHEKAKRGEYPTIAPVGYLNDPRNKTIVIDRARASAVRDAFALYAEGNSRLEDIANFFLEHGVISKRGGKRLHLTVVTNILSNPFYYGHFRYAGELYEGKYKPIISKALFDKAQAVLKKRGWQDRKENDPAHLCGLLICAQCGCSITADEKTKNQKNGNVHKYVYYRCTKKRGVCSQPHIREEALSSQLSEAIKPFALPVEWAAELTKLANADEQSALVSSAAASQAMREELTSISERQKRLLAVYLDEDIEQELYLSEKADLLSRKKAVQEEMASLQKGQVAWLEPLRGWIKDASLLNEITETAPLPAKKISAKKIFGTNLFLNNRLLVSTPTPPYASLREARLNFLGIEFSQLMVPFLGIEPRSVALAGCPENCCKFDFYSGSV
jgi:DNA invertase Pin-like site-specific DNA recombinase